MAFQHECNLTQRPKFHCSTWILCLQMLKVSVIGYKALCGQKIQHEDSLSQQWTPLKKERQYSQFFCRNHNLKSDFSMKFPWTNSLRFICQIPVNNVAFWDITLQSWTWEMGNGYGQDIWGIGVWFLAWTKDFSLLQSIQASSRAWPVSCTMGTSSSFGQ